MHHSVQLVEQKKGAVQKETGSPLQNFFTRIELKISTSKISEILLQHNA